MPRVKDSPAATLFSFVQRLRIYCDWRMLVVKINNAWATIVAVSLVKVFSFLVTLSMEQMHRDWFLCTLALEHELVLSSAYAEMSVGEQIVQGIWKRLNEKLNDRSARVTIIAAQSLTAGAIFLQFSHTISSFAFTMSLITLALSATTVFAASLISWKLEDMPVWDLKCCALHYPHLAAFTLALPQALGFWSAACFVVALLAVSWNKGAFVTFALVLGFLGAICTWILTMLIGSIMVGRAIDLQKTNDDWFFTDNVEKVLDKQVALGGRVRLSLGGQNRATLSSS